MLWLSWNLNYSFLALLKFLLLEIFLSRSFEKLLHITWQQVFNISDNELLKNIFEKDLTLFNLASWELIAAGIFKNIS
jgi:hypothetical protein